MACAAYRNRRLWGRGVQREDQFRVIANVQVAYQGFLVDVQQITYGLEVIGQCGVGPSVCRVAGQIDGELDVANPGILCLPMIQKLDHQGWQAPGLGECQL